MTPHKPTIDLILGTFFSTSFARCSGVKLHRTRIVESLLSSCLERDGHRILVDSDRAVLAAERQFDPDRAFARTMHAEDLLFAIGIFIAPEWLAVDTLVRRRQLEVAENLVAHLIDTQLVREDGFECMLLDLRFALDRGLAGVTAERREPKAKGSVRRAEPGGPSVRPASGQVP